MTKCRKSPWKVGCECPWMHHVECSLSTGIGGCLQSNDSFRDEKGVRWRRQTAAPEDETVDRVFGLGYRIVKPLNEPLPWVMDKKYITHLVCAQWKPEWSAVMSTSLLSAPALYKFRNDWLIINHIKSLAKQTHAGVRVFDSGGWIKSRLFISSCRKQTNNTILWSVSAQRQ